MDKKSIFKSILVAVLVIGFLVSSAYTILNLYSINQNTRTLLTDFSASRVSEINPDESIVLENTEVIDGSSIVSYVKVNKGSGTWYIKDSNTLIVETTFKDLASMVITNLIYVIGILFVLGYSILKYKDTKKGIVPSSIVSVVFVGCIMYFIYEYLFKVLDIV